MNNKLFILAIVAMIGCLIVIFGVCQEAHGQVGLMANEAAYRSYMEMTNLQLGFVEFMTQGIQMKMSSFGGNTQAYGFAVIFLSPVVALLATPLFPRTNHID